jgi:hypothetical protein
MKKVLTTKTFAEKANKVHNNKYDYSLLVYNNYWENVIILCPIHKQFLQTPANHLSGRGCPSCAGVARITLQDAQNLATQYDGELLSESVKSVRSPLLWKCAKDHIFEKPYVEIKRRGTWCKLCSLPWKSEEICRVYFETIFNKKFPKYRGSWLINKFGIKLELDGFCEELKLAFEHQGEQHYKKSSLYTHQQFEKLQENDIDKLEACKNNGIKLIIIPQLYKITDIDSLENTVKLLAKEYNISIKNDYTYSFSHISNSSYCEERLEVFRQIAKNHGGKCLSTEYITAKHKYEFECAAGHTWKSSVEHLLDGRWCAKCTRKQRTINKIGLSKEELEKIYTENNGNILKTSKQLNTSEGTLKRVLKLLNIDIRKNDK